MSADHVAVLVATIAAALTTVVLVIVTVVQGRRLRQLGRTVEELRRETVPLVRDARVVVDQAATEMVRVGDVLDSAEAVSATVDSASRLAYHAFSNPVVKVLAFGTGLGSALRRLVGRTPGADVAGTPAREAGRGRPRHAGTRRTPPGATPAALGPPRSPARRRARTAAGRR
ncbi:MAG TPA: hypothetical protein VMB72_09185 [Acidimicrobiales bacterium]|nr:hypothetical protein [Acidimicrobiales bacterium]